ncbi:AraC family transcriptional regulator [Streptomyces sp. BE20]|uniref:AraC family transcriptional regulator n=1 Tax=Streptomyces sp. BE20 TaxID=3002525 RepID=UPI002E77F410|nr:AraC family transcriptional regulator [Streptomyces sp. BE20]MEE1827720.1 AraC family transcriptional regulator [Streptomyces sp. BE20]
MDAPLSAPAPGRSVWGDPLAEALELTGVRCVLSRGLTAAGAWALAFPAPGRLKVQAVLQGTIWLVVEGVERPVRLEAGAMAVLAGDRPYTLASDPAVPAVDALPLLRASAEPFLHTGDDGRDAVTIGGHMELDSTAKDLLLSALPPVMHVSGATAEAPTACWLMDQTLRELAADRPGASFAAGHLAPLVLVQVLRAFLADADAGSCPAGWLRALADERIAPALRLMHGDPARPWTLAELARAAAMSRTSFAKRFKDVAGVPPLAYLRRWRMHRAEHTLRRADTPLSVIASALGYGSESAFSNAFKRTTGLSPRHYRETVRSA